MGFIAFFLNPRVLLTLAVLAALGLAYRYAYNSGAEHVQLEWDAAVSAANSEARQLERARQSAVDAAVKIATETAQRDHRLAADARDERDGLRDTLDAVERASKESHAAALKHVTALRTVLDSCTAEYLVVAELAAGHYRDDQTCRNSIYPK